MHWLMHAHDLPGMWFMFCFVLLHSLLLIRSISLNSCPAAATTLDGDRIQPYRFQVPNQRQPSQCARPPTGGRVGCTKHDRLVLPSHPTLTLLFLACTDRFLIRSSYRRLPAPIFFFATLTGWNQDSNLGSWEKKESNERLSRIKSIFDFCAGNFIWLVEAMTRCIIALRWGDFRSVGCSSCTEGLYTPALARPRAWVKIMI